MRLAGHDRILSAGPCDAGDFVRTSLGTRTPEKTASMTKSPLAPFVAGQTLSSYQIRDDQDELADIERLRQVSLVASD